MTTAPENGLPPDQCFSPEEVEEVRRRNAETMKWAEAQFRPGEFNPDAEER